MVGVSAQLAGANTLKQVTPTLNAAIKLTASNDDPQGGTLDPRTDVLSWDVYAQIGGCDVFGHFGTMPRSSTRINEREPMLLAIGRAQLRKRDWPRRALHGGLRRHLSSRILAGSNKSLCEGQHCIDP